MTTKFLQCRLNVVALLLVLLASGCSRHQELPDALYEYHQRLARVLDVDALEVSFVYDKRFNNRQSMYQEPDTISINVREFFNLPDCSLSTIIAERNTALGKAHLPSQRFVYEVELLQGLQACIDVTRQGEVKDKLISLHRLKSNHLPINYSNLLATSDEVFLSLTQSPGFISGDASDGFHESISAWQYLRDIRATENSEIDSTELENHLKTLEQTRLLARQWRSQQILIQWLTASNVWLSSLLNDWQCDSLQQQQKATTLRNVFSLFFADKIQPIASQLNHYHYQLLPIIQSLIDDPVITASWREAARQHLTAEHEEYRAAMMAHIKIWQTLFAQCNLAPGRTG
ncbi:DUF3080 family protein [Alteromonas sp. ASW11-36]|uniref:DUF3080 family protein n=1 Tax=Alteromonas arenosi TaxID=3055817 RepID=A0ABT7SY45_9ALTE|nr:DUF3080 family protein [Alteromonas sp. ASW11-36]MDM7861118.1 DUF3080 family protein [Alteromonas sp. ASW11-36]